MNFWLLCGVFVVSLLGILMHIKYGAKVGLLDIPNERSSHTKPVPRGAGIPFVLSVFVVLVSFDFAYFKTNFYVYLSIAIVFSAGVWDDLKNISPKIKLVFIFFASFVLYMNNISISSLGTYFGYELNLPALLIFPFTFFAIAGYTNALNLMDGLDGLAASISLVMLTTFLIIGIEYQDKLLISLSSLFITTLLVFLWFNWHPAKLFMGDSGSLSLGITIAILAIQSLHYISPPSVLFIIALPLLDTFIVMTRRMQRHQSPFKADRNHMHHFLFNVKGDIPYTVIMLTMMQSVFSIIGFQVKQANDLISLVLFGLLFYIYLNLFDQRLKRRKKTDEEHYKNR